MNKILSIIVCLFMALSVKAQSYNQLIEKAMEYTKRDSLVQAEDLFRQALKSDPKNARNALLFSNLGTVLKRQGKTDEALEAYTMALNITPYATSILLNRAALYMEKNLLNKAYVDYCNVIDLLPENIEARLFRAYIYMEQRQYAEARIDYNVVLGKDAKNRTARLGIIMLDEKEGRYASARDGLNLMIQENPHDTSLLKMRANIELEDNHPELALVDIEEVINVTPADAEAYIMQGDILLSMKKKEAGNPPPGIGRKAAAVQISLFGETANLLSCLPISTIKAFSYLKNSPKSLFINDFPHHKWFILISNIRRTRFQPLPIKSPFLPIKLYNPAR